MRISFLNDKINIFYDDCSGNTNKLSLSEWEIRTTSFNANVQFLDCDLISLEIRIIREIRVILVVLKRCVRVIIAIIRCSCTFRLVFLFLFELLLKNQRQLIPNLDFL